MGKFLTILLITAFEVIQFVLAIIGIFTIVFFIQMMGNNAYIYSTNDPHMSNVVKEALENEKTRKAKENVLEAERNQEQRDVSDQE